MLNEMQFATNNTLNTGHWRAVTTKTDDGVHIDFNGVNGANGMVVVTADDVTDVRISDSSGQHTLHGRIHWNRVGRVNVLIFQGNYTYTNQWTTKFEGELGLVLAVFE